MTFIVPTTSVPLLHDPPFVFWLCLLAAAIGIRVFRLLKLSGSDVSRLERGVLTVAVGLGLLSNVGLTLGSLRQLTPTALRWTLCLLTLVFSVDMIRVSRSLLQSAQIEWRNVFSPVKNLPHVNEHAFHLDSAQHVRNAAPPGVNWLLPFSFFLFPFLQALCPCTDADGLAYHLRAPKEWLKTGSLDFLPTLTHANSPLGVEMLYALPLAIWSDTAAKLIHFAFGTLTLLAIFTLGRRLFDWRVGLSSAWFFALGLPNAPVLTLFSYAYVDLGIALEMACATLAWFVWQRTQRLGWLLICGLCAGFAFAFKLTGGAYVLAFALLTLWEMRKQSVSQAPLMLSFLASGCLPALPWLLRSWNLTGNPVYPLFPGVFPTRDWSVAHGHAFDTFMRLYNWGSGHVHWSHDLRVKLLAAAIAVYSVLLLALWHRYAEANVRRLLLLAAIPTLLAFATTGLYGRFLIPLLPLHALLLFGLSEPLWRSRAWLFLAFAGWLVLNGTLYLRSSQPHASEALRVVTGRESREQYLLNQLPPMSLWNYANANLPPHDTILVFGFGDAYYCNNYCYVCKAFYQHRFRLDTWEHFLSDVQRDHVGYIMVAPNAAPVPEYGPSYLPADNVNVFPQRLAREYGQPLASASDLTLYHVKLPAVK